MDVYEPMEEGLDTVTDIRTISSLRATLTVTSPEGISSNPGYMAPQEVSPKTEEGFLERV